MTYLRPPRLPGGRSCRRAGAALAAAVLAALALAISGSGAALAAPQASTATATTTPGCAVTSVSDATWMDDLTPCLQNHKLSQIVIPGSHDTLTYGFGPVAYLGYATTQDEDITAQLNGGMRDFDIRVGWQNSAYYAEHGKIYGLLQLPSVLTSIAQWATQPSHEHEILRLALNINQNTTGPFPTSTCQAFGNALGGSLLTPDEVQSYFGTTDVGQVTLGQLWSLPDPSNAARVIIDGSDQCMHAAAGTDGADAGTWTASSAYYVDYGCSPATNTNALVQAAQQRATEGKQPTNGPISLGPPHPGGLYELDIQETPNNPPGCLLTPGEMAPDQKGFLNALENAWETQASVRNNLNLVLGDFVETIPLAADAIAMDEWLDIGTAPEVAFQAAGTEDLWSTGTDNHGDWGLRIMPGTSPSITLLRGGGYEIAYVDNHGDLNTVGTEGTKDWGLVMRPHTSPAITDLYGGGYEVAYQDGNGILETVGSGGGSDTQDWGAGMMAGTSPAITGLLGGGYVMALQGPRGYLWTDGTAGTQYWGLGMMAGTSPSIEAPIFGVG